MDYVVRMYRTERDPVNSVDMKSWFLFYKWMVEGEVHYDISNTAKENLYLQLETGDRLWFLMDFELIGYVDVLRIQEDPTRDVWEIWYDGSKCHKFKNDILVETASFGTIVPKDVAEMWLTHCEA